MRVTVKMNAKLYFFKNKNEKWTALESSNTIDESRFNDCDKDEDLKKLRQGETVALDITPSDES